MITELRLQDIPFSAYGSALTIQKIVAGQTDAVPKGADDAGFYVQTKPAATFDAGYYLRALYEDDRYRLLYRLSFDGSFEGMEDEMRPEVLTLKKGAQTMDICFAADDTLRFKGRCERFEMYMSEREIIKYNAAMFLDERHVGLNTYTRKSMVYAIKGRLELDAPWGDNESNVYIRVIAHPDENGDMEFAYKDFRTEFVKDYLTSVFDEDARRSRDSFESFASRIGDCKHVEYADAWRTAEFILWENVVSPNQLIRRYAVLADKDWNCEARHTDSMLMLWALMPGQPELAWEQFMLFAEQQDASGAMPAWIGSYKIDERSVRMPLSGVVIGELLKKDALNAAQQEIAFEVMRREANFWKHMRDYDGDGLPEYCYPTECGENGCGVFDSAIWLETPDLCAYLILEYFTLSALASKLGKPHEEWEHAAVELLERLLSQLWIADSQEFISRNAGDHTPCPSKSLINLLPVILGEHLPEHVRYALLRALADGWLCEAGVASEALDSTDSDKGYALRGCVWSPWVLLTVKALMDCGEREASAALAKRFCQNVAKHGFRERYSARNGEGAGGRANSLAAAAFIIMLRDYAGEAST